MIKFPARAMPEICKFDQIAPVTSRATGAGLTTEKSEYCRFRLDKTSTAGKLQRTSSFSVPNRAEREILTHSLGDLKERGQVRELRIPIEHPSKAVFGYRIEHVGAKVERL